MADPNCGLSGCELASRRSRGVEEVVLATNTSIKDQTTASYVVERLEDMVV